MRTKANEGWSGTHCTKDRCRTELEPGQGNQFVDQKGKEQRYCWKHWKELNADLGKSSQETK